MAAILDEAVGRARSLALSASLPVWAARFTALLLPQGTLALLLHAYFGFEADHAGFPLGLKLDPLHAATHMAWGAAGAYVGFLKPRWAVPYMLAFGVYYVALSFLGTFTGYHFGMQLGWRENVAHWTLGPLGLLIGLYGLARPDRRR